MSHELLAAVVIGAGQAGLAAGYHLQRAGLDFVLVEASDTPGGSWPRYYDSLTLFSPARYSALPGMPFPGDPDRYPTRDEVADYLRRYANRFALPVVCRSRVGRVVRTADHFRVETSRGVYHARVVIAATGSFGDPSVPNLLGRADFSGRVLHSAQYRSPEPFARQRVVVVGGGNSGVQIAVELASVARVSLAVRQPVRLVPQRLLGCDLHCWLQWTGIDRTNWLQDRGGPLVLDAGDYRRALEAGRPEERPMFTRFTPNGVIWPDEGEEAIDTVIFATGFRPRFDYLAGLGALDEDGAAMHRQGISTSVPGLYYVGLPGQRAFASATLRGVGPDAARIVRHLRRRLTSAAMHSSHAGRTS